MPSESMLLHQLNRQGKGAIITLSHTATNSGTVDRKIFSGKIFRLLNFCFSSPDLFSICTCVCNVMHKKYFMCFNFRQEGSSTKIFNDENFPDLRYLMFALFWVYI